MRNRVALFLQSVGRRLSPNRIVPVIFTFFVFAHYLFLLPQDHRDLPSILREKVRVIGKSVGTLFFRRRGFAHCGTLVLAEYEQGKPVDVFNRLIAE